MEKNLKIKKTADEIFAKILPICIGWILLANLLDYLYKKGIDYFDYTKWDITDTVGLIIIAIIGGVFVTKMIYEIRISGARYKLKKRLRPSHFKKVKIDFNDCAALSKTILQSNSIEAFAKLQIETIDERKIIVKIVFQGFDEDGNPSEVQQIHEFEEDEIEFLEVEN